MSYKCCIGSIWYFLAYIISRLVRVNMEIKGEAKLLRILSEDDRHGSVSLYEKIVLKAKETGMAGATVYKGIMSFGGN